MRAVSSNVSALFLFLVMGMSTNCSKSSDPGPAFSLAGNWRVINSASTECTNPDQNSSLDYVACPPVKQMEMCLEYTFTSDGKVTINYLLYLDGSASGMLSQGTYSMSGRKLTIKITSPNSAEPETTDVELSGDILKMTRARTSDYDCITTFTMIKV